LAENPVSGQPKTIHYLAFVGLMLLVSMAAAMTVQLASGMTAQFLAGEPDAWFGRLVGASLPAFFVGALVAAFTFRAGDRVRTPMERYVVPALVFGGCWGFAIVANVTDYFAARGLRDTPRAHQTVQVSFLLGTIAVAGILLLLVWLTQAFRRHQ
jgi:hypothetical protein